jgi:hypothetical protein
VIRNIERDYRIIYTCTNPPVPIYVDMARKHLAEGVARRFIMIGDSLEAIDRSRRGSRCCHGTHDRVVRDWKLQTCIGAIWTRGNSDSGSASAGLGRLRARLRHCGARAPTTHRPAVASWRPKRSPTYPEMDCPPYRYPVIVHMCGVKIAARQISIGAAAAAALWAALRDQAL